MKSFGNLLINFVLLETDRLLFGHSGIEADGFRLNDCAVNTIIIVDLESADPEQCTSFSLFQIV